MEQQAVILYVIVLLLGVMLVMAAVLDELAEPEEIIVSSVIDGDTFMLSSGETVRLICIDTPERNESGYEEAKDYLSHLILGRPVVLERDVSETDRYKRLLRYVYVDDIFVNRKMVQEGYAGVAEYPPDVSLCAVIGGSLEQGCERLGCPEAAAVGSKNSDVWHYCNCSVRIRQENIVCFSTIEEAEEMGYRKSRVC